MLIKCAHTVCSVREAPFMGGVYCAGSKSLIIKNNTWLDVKKEKEKKTPTNQRALSFRFLCLLLRCFTTVCWSMLNFELKKFLADFFNINLMLKLQKNMDFIVNCSWCGVMDKALDRRRSSTKEK